MGVIVSFDYAGWMARYPEFANVTQPQAQGYFNEATLYHRNDGQGPVNNPASQDLFLKMLTAHIAALYAPDLQGQPASTIVGRIASASEGSVSVSADMKGPESAEWYYQTKYGTSYWNATKQYRTMRYKHGHVRPTNPFLNVGGGFIR